MVIVVETVDVGDTAVGYVHDIVAGDFADSAILEMGQRLVSVFQSVVLRFGILGYGTTSFGSLWRLKTETRWNGLFGIGL